MFTEVQRLRIAKVFPYFQVGTAIGLEALNEFFFKHLKMSREDQCIAFDLSLLNFLQGDYDAKPKTTSTEFTIHGVDVGDILDVWINGKRFRAAGANVK